VRWPSSLHLVLDEVIHLEEAYHAHHPHPSSLPKQNLNGASAGQPTFLNIGAPHPDPRRFIGVIWGQYRSSFPMLPEYLYKDGTICVFGRIEPYDGVAEIIIIWIRSNPDRAGSAYPQRGKLAKVSALPGSSL
jgi:hypothetical protein